MRIKKYPNKRAPSVKPKLAKRVAADKIMIEAPSEQAFWVHDGPMLRNLRELKNFFEVITIEQFRYHTKRDGNDFARWVTEVLKDSSLGAILAKTKTIPAARLALIKALKIYNG